MRCPQCEFNPKPESDYLCAACRNSERTESMERYDAFTQAQPEIAAYLLRAFHQECRLSPWEKDFTSSLFEQIIVKGKTLSAKQITVANKLVASQAKRDEERANAVNIEDAIDNFVEGERFRIVGKVISAKDRPGFDGRGWVTKLTIADKRGFKVWGSCPGKLMAGKGDTVALDATITVSKDDPTFGFYKRPADGVIIEKGESHE